MSSTLPLRFLVASGAWHQVSVLLLAEISRQQFRFSLALRAGEILPRTKPKEAARANRSISPAVNELAASIARNAARTSPSQIAIACSTSASNQERQMPALP